MRSVAQDESPRQSAGRGTTKASRFQPWLHTLLLAGGCAYLFFFGLGSIGLMGADEPRYAQIAREMLVRCDWVTPVLHGVPWLEKPILYYWEAMLAYRLFGVSDWAARLPAAVNTSLLVLAVYWFMRRHAAIPGNDAAVAANDSGDTALDAALMFASLAFVTGFGRAASTDAPLAASFGFAMLAWLLWAMEGHRGWLLVFHFFLGLGTLAKGPVAPLLAGIAIVAFAVLRRRAGIVWRTLWWPAVALYLAVTLPWYVLVQRRTGDFLQVFLWSHNVQRFSTPVFHHTQPFWYYLPVMLVALAPWTVLAIAGWVDGIRQSRPGKAVSPPRQAKNGLAGDPAPPQQAKNGLAGDPAPPQQAKNGLAGDPVEGPGPQGISSGQGEFHAGDLSFFLVLWGAAPVLFFSFSGSKLPGYILPALPPFAMLFGLWLERWRESGNKLPAVLLRAHALAAGATFTAVLLAPNLVLHLHPPGAAVGMAVAGGVVIFCVVLLGVRAHGLLGLRLATLLPVILGLAFLLRVAAPALDPQLSARAVAQDVLRLEPANAPVATYGLGRELAYGLGFYLDRPVARYENGEIPSSPHFLVSSSLAESALAPVTDRRIVSLGKASHGAVIYYWVSGE
jgi:4-amino-4-deoxy-L-arabinose transferase-like glycosyltransferase